MSCSTFNIVKGEIDKYQKNCNFVLNTDVDILSSCIAMAVDTYRGKIDTVDPPPGSGSPASAPDTPPSSGELKTVEGFRQRIDLLKNEHEAHAWMKKHQKELKALSKADRGDVMKAYLKRIPELRGAKSGGSK